MCVWGGGAQRVGKGSGRTEVSRGGVPGEQHQREAWGLKGEMRKRRVAERRREMSGQKELHGEDDVDAG